MYHRRDEPGFLVKYAESMGFVLSAGIVLWGVGSGVRRWVQQRKKDRIDKYYDAIQDIMAKLQDGTGLSYNELEEMDTKLLEIQATTSRELVDEKLLANESYLIYQNMLQYCHSMVAEKKNQPRTKKNSPADSVAKDTPKINRPNT